jgi:hypothetical protein
MKEIKPVIVRSIKAISKNRDNQEISRILNLGIFSEDITIQDIISVISKEKLWMKVSTSSSFPIQDNIEFVEEVFQLSEGVVYDDLNEFSNHVKSGVYYHDVITGYNLSNIHNKKVQNKYL